MDQANSDPRKIEVVVARNSREPFSAGACPAWDEPGPFLSVMRSEPDERR